MLDGNRIKWDPQLGLCGLAGIRSQAGGSKGPSGGAERGGGSVSGIDESAAVRGREFMLGYAEGCIEEAHDLVTEATQEALTRAHEELLVAAGVLQTAIKLGGRAQ
ncbi:hypothetical protein I6B53_03380 [Schaalia sp. 19OD2882]|uniref:hypothetical protein n=1 Tax=Schaalia sp. 19OD2882 TaxID=2794089 RepID=UPI001C1F0FB2|nr:hypothetical protein [Schaalia sp. 19OD2882]QWW20153.1 hypothetical protein I6B53_03380 [Schaalia sp. 19OD2882]